MDMMQAAQQNDATNEETSNVPLEEDIRPFSDIKTRVEDVVDSVVRK